MRTRARGVGEIELLRRGDAIAERPVRRLPLHRGHRSRSGRRVLFQRRQRLATRGGGDRGKGIGHLTRSRRENRPQLARHAFDVEPRRRRTIRKRRAKTRDGFGAIKYRPRAQRRGRFDVDQRAQRRHAAALAKRRRRARIPRL